MNTPCSAKNFQSNPCCWPHSCSIMSDEKALREILNWIRTKKNQTEKDPESVRWLSYLFIGNNTDPPQLDTGSRYSSILCFIISTLIVFIFSLVVALAALRCYDFYRTRSQVREYETNQKPFKWKSQPQIVILGSLNIKFMIETTIRPLGCPINFWTAETQLQLLSNVSLPFEILQLKKFLIPSFWSCRSK